MNKRSNEFLKLRCLDICGATSFNDSHIEELVLNAPDLTSLKLSGCFCLDDAGVAHIHGYRGLQELSLSNALPVTSSAECSLDRIPSPRELHFDERFLDRDLLQSMMSVKYLRVVGGVVEVDSRGFDIICTHFEKLETLSMTLTHTVIVIVMTMTLAHHWSKVTDSIVLKF